MLFSKKQKKEEERREDGGWKKALKGKRRSEGRDWKRILIFGSNYLVVFRITRMHSIV